MRQKYVNLKREVKKKIRESKRSYEIRIAREAKENPKSFDQQYQSKNKEKIGPIEVGNGHITNEDREMCSCLNKYFLSIFTNENLEYFPEVEAIYSGGPDNMLSSININRDDVIR